jgi:hypothetical protein
VTLPRPAVPRSPPRRLSLPQSAGQIRVPSRACSRPGTFLGALFAYRRRLDECGAEELGERVVAASSIRTGISAHSHHEQLEECRCRTLPFRPPPRS